MYLKINIHWLLRLMMMENLCIWVFCLILSNCWSFLNFMKKLISAFMMRIYSVNMIFLLLRDLVPLHNACSYGHYEVTELLVKVSSFVVCWFGGHYCDNWNVLFTGYGRASKSAGGSAPGTPTDAETHDNEICGTEHARLLNVTETVLVISRGFFETQGGHMWLP